MSYSEEIKSKSLEAFKSVPWSNTPDAVTNSAPSASNEDSDNKLFLDTRDHDDSGIDSLAETDESYSDLIPSKPSRFAIDKKETAKPVIKSKTRPDSSTSSDLAGNPETDLQRIAVVMLSKKNTLMFAKSTAVIVLLLFGMGLWSDYSKLGEARVSSDPDELRRYLSSQSTYIWDTEIRLRLSDIETSTYEQAKTTGDIEDYKGYLRDFPNGRYFDETLDSIGSINQSGGVQ